MSFRRNNPGPFFGFQPQSLRYQVDETVWLSTEHVMRGWLEGRICDGTSVRVMQTPQGWRAYLRGVELEGAPTPSWEGAAERLVAPLLAERKRLRYRG